MTNEEVWSHDDVEFLAQVANQIAIAVENALSYRELSEMKERLATIKFLDVTTSMLPSGVPFPVIPQAPEIMNIIVPDMLQNALTGKMTVDQAAEDAAAKVKEVVSGM